MVAPSLRRVLQHLRLDGEGDEVELLQRLQEWGASQAIHLCLLPLSLPLVTPQAQVQNPSPTITYPLRPYPPPPYPVTHWGWVEC